ncbi:MAG TPA: ChbG/HpnK family deacetylase [Acidobacteriaceae bacterium]|nr:ChbG/HpnK family deacetylase [Acidobacteriaceae bacterium]
MKRLIVNADDFGLTAGVNSAITHLHAAKRLTSATLMAHAQATEAAIEAARATPTLGVGCHVVLVDGAPILPPRELPTLTDPQTGRFRRTLGVFVRDLLLSRIRPEEIEAEATAQITRLRTHGLSPTHIDTHKHTHIFPRVLEPLLKAASRCNIPSIRNPFEPQWSITATPNAPAMRRLQVHVLNRMRNSFLRSVRASSLTTTDGAIGVLATGTLDAATIASLLSAMPSGTWELVTHPGYVDDALPQAGTRLIASRAIELAALQAMHASADLEWIHFGQLHSPQAEAAHR